MENNELVFIENQDGQFEFDSTYVDDISSALGSVNADVTAIASTFLEGLAKKYPDLQSLPEFQFHYEQANLLEETHRKMAEVYRQKTLDARANGSILTANRYREGTT